MKKIFVAILSLLYISTATGVTINMHYCMGELADWGIAHNKSRSCGKCGMEKSEEKNNGCCNDEQKFIKNNSDQKAAEPSFKPAQFFPVALSTSFFELSNNNFSSVTEKDPVSHAPPRSGGAAVYIRNCIFLI